MLDVQRKEYRTKRGIKLSVSPISNLDLFAFKNNIQTVQVPRFYIESQKRWVENPDDPRYHDAQIILENSKSLKAFDYFIESSISLEDKALLESEEWKEFYENLLDIDEELLENSDEMFNYIKFFALADASDQQNLIKSVCLTETAVFEMYNKITISRFGTNVHDIDIKNAIDTGITYSNIIIGGEQLVNPLDEYTACVASKLNWIEWIRSVYTLTEKAATVALFRLNRLKEMHIDDEQQIQMEKKSK